MGTSVEKDNAVVGGICDCFLHPIEVEAFGRLGEIWICRDGNVNIGEDLIVVGPGWVAEINGRLARVELGQEQASEMDSSCA